MRRSRRSTSARRISAGGASSISASSATSARPSRRCCRCSRPRRDRKHLDDAVAHYKKAREGLDDLATGTPGSKPIHPQYLASLISEHAADDAVFTSDVGTPTVWAARYLTMNGRRRLIGSFVHGSMANAMPQAIGAQAAQPGRQVISLSGDGGFTMLMGDLITLTQMKLPVKVVIFNNGVLGFVAMEMKAAGFVDTGVDLENPDFAAMARAMGIFAMRVEDPGELARRVKEMLAHDGPALLDVVTAKQELSMPPTITRRAGQGLQPLGVARRDERPRRRGHRPREDQSVIALSEISRASPTARAIAHGGAGSAASAARCRSSPPARSRARSGSTAIPSAR